MEKVKVILLERRRIPKEIYILVGILYILIGAGQLYSSHGKLLTIFLGSVLILLGLWITLAGSGMKSLESRLSPKVKIDQDKFSGKTTFFGKSFVCHWKDVKDIEFDSFIIRFRIKKGMESFRYNCIPEISIDIKNEVRKIAELKEIPVSGG